jgi:alpha-amylase
MVGINKCGTEVAFDIDTNQRFFWYRNYREQLTNTTLRIESGRFTFRLPARSARMWTVE